MNSSHYAKLNQLASNQSIRSSKRGVTPAPTIPLKLINKHARHETGYNIITNRDVQNASKVQNSESKLLTQQSRDYQDYTKSDYSFNYPNGNKQFSISRIARKYIRFYDGKKEREIPSFVKELIADEEKLTKLLEDVYHLKNALTVQDLCMFEDGLFDVIFRNFELLDASNKRELIKDYDKLLDGNKVGLNENTIELILSKLKQDARVDYNRIMQFYDLYKFMISRENNSYSPSERLGLSYRPVTDMNIKSIHNMINFLWVKIEEKFQKTSHAFRFFDEKSRSKISYREFENAIAKLKIKFHKNDIKEVFKYLDADKDKFLNYIEFSKLNQNNNFTSRMPANEFEIKNSPGGISKASSRAKSNDYAIRDQDNKLAYNDIDQISVSSFYYKGYKYGGSRLGRQSSRMSNYSWISMQKHGIPSPANDNMNEIMHHSYIYDNLKAREMYKGHMPTKKIVKVVPNIPTKASKLRDDFMKQQRMELSESKLKENEPLWKLRQFKGIGPSENIVESMKQIKHKHANQTLNISKSKFECS